MIYIFAIVIFLHAIIHIMGFLKAFGIAKVEALTKPIRKPQGILWLLTCLLFLTYLLTYLMNSPYAWVIGILAVLVSQTLIVCYWKDAKFGTLPNIVILLVSIVSLGSYTFNRMVEKETLAILNQISIPSDKRVAETDTIGLPEPIKRWLDRSGVTGKPYIVVGKVIQKAEMKTRPDQQDWLDANAIQYSTIDIPAFIWTVNVKMNSMIHLKGRDKFLDGQGEMLIKLYSLFNVVNAKGEKLSEGTIQRYLGEMVWFPTLALSSYISWEQIDANTAIATIDYKGTKGSGIFHFDAEGDFIKFSAMRFMGNEPDSERREWILSVDAHSTFEGIRVPTKMTATWKLDEGDWTWLNLEIEDIAYNENVRVK